MNAGNNQSLGEERLVLVTSRNGNSYNLFLVPGMERPSRFCIEYPYFFFEVEDLDLFFSSSRSFSFSEKRSLEPRPNLVFSSIPKT